MGGSPDPLYGYRNDPHTEEPASPLVFVRLRQTHPTSVITMHHVTPEKTANIVVIFSLTKLSVMAIQNSGSRNGVSVLVVGQRDEVLMSAITVAESNVPTLLPHSRYTE